MPSSSKPSLLPVVKQEQRKAHHPSIALLIPCSSFITMESSSSYISFCTPSLVALLYLPIKVNKAPQFLTDWMLPIGVRVLYGSV